MESDVDSAADTDDSNLAPNTELDLVNQQPSHIQPQAQQSESKISEVSERVTDLVESFHETRWKRLRKFYRDQYLDLFKTTFSEDDNKIEHFEDSQLGAVTWTGAEKERIFEALTRKGRHDLQAIQAHVPTKSILEITEYLDLLRETEADRQRFEAEHKNVSHVHIPAAIEVGRKCEAELEMAADALAAFQDSYDHAAASKADSRRWVVDWRRAATLDKETKEREDTELENETVLDRPASLFNVSEFLNLSKRIFMNVPEQSEYDHWNDIAEPGQYPALTEDVLAILQNLVTNLTRRILQSSIFLAKSRIRASTTTSYATLNFMKPGDVRAALDILGLPHDSFDFWTDFARRTGVNVVLGDHVKGFNSQQFLSLEQIENALSVRKGSGKRRSLSQLAGISSDSEMELDIGESLPEKKGQMQQYTIVPSVEIEEGGDTEDEQNSDQSLGSSQSEASDSVPQRDVFVNRQERRLMVEEAQDEYMEKIDRQAREQEEALLFNILGSTSFKVEGSPELGKKPKTLRKTNEELEHWTDDLSYLSQWERDGNAIPSETFIRPKKRRKFDDTSDTKHKGNV